MPVESSRTFVPQPATSRGAHFFPKTHASSLVRLSPWSSADPCPSCSLSLWVEERFSWRLCVSGRPLDTMLGLLLLCSLKSSIPVNPSGRIKEGGKKKPMRSCWKAREGRMLTGEESHKTQSHVFPKSSSRYSPRLFRSLKRGESILCFAAQEFK